MNLTPNKIKELDEKKEYSQEEVLENEEFSFDNPTKWKEEPLDFFFDDLKAQKPEEGKEVEDPYAFFDFVSNCEGTNNTSVDEVREFEANKNQADKEIKKECMKENENFEQCKRTLSTSKKIGLCNSSYDSIYFDNNYNVDDTLYMSMMKRENQNDGTNEDSDDEFFKIDEINFSSFTFNTSFDVEKEKEKDIQNEYIQNDDAKNTVDIYKNSNGNESLEHSHKGNIIFNETTTTTTNNNSIQNETISNELKPVSIVQDDFSKFDYIAFEDFTFCNVQESVIHTSEDFQDSKKETEEAEKENQEFKVIEETIHIRKIENTGNDEFDRKDKQEEDPFLCLLHEKIENDNDKNNNMDFSNETKENEVFRVLHKEEKREENMEVYNVFDNEEYDSCTKNEYNINIIKNENEDKEEDSFPVDLSIPTEDKIEPFSEEANLITEVCNHKEATKLNRATEGITNNAIESSESLLEFSLANNQTLQNIKYNDISALDEAPCNNCENEESFSNFFENESIAMNGEVQHKQEIGKYKDLLEDSFFIEEDDSFLEDNIKSSKEIFVTIEKSPEYDKIQDDFMINGSVMNSGEKIFHAIDATDNKKEEPSVTERHNEVSNIYTLRTNESRESTKEKDLISFHNNEEIQDFEFEDLSIKIDNQKECEVAEQSIDKEKSVKEDLIENKNYGEIEFELKEENKEIILDIIKYKEEEEEDEKIKFVIKENEEVMEVSNTDESIRNINNRKEPIQINDSKMKKKNKKQCLFKIKEFKYGKNSFEFMRAQKGLPCLQFLKCSQLKPYLHLFNIAIKIVSFLYTDGLHSYFLGGDETGCVHIKLDKSYEFICKENEMYIFHNCNILSENDSIILSISEYSKVTPLKYKIIPNVDVNKNFSEASFVSLYSYKKYFS